MKIEYEKVGEYYSPNLTVKEKKINLSKYGRMKLQYMKKYQKILYTNLLTSGGLYEYVEMIDHQANALYDKLLVDMKRQRNITEELKEENQMLWIQEMNNKEIRLQKNLSHIQHHFLLVKVQLMLLINCLKNFRTAF